MKIISKVILFLLISFVVHANSYEAILTDNLPKVIKERKFDVNVHVKFLNEALYNDMMKLSYHVYDSQGKRVRYENDRKLFNLVNGEATVPFHIELPAGDNLEIIFDIIDEKNIFWFLETHPNKLSTESKILKIDNSFFYKSSKVVLNIFHEQKMILFFNILSFILIIFGILFYKKRNKSVAIAEEKFEFSVEKADMELKEKPITFVCEKEGFLSRLFSKLFFVGITNDIKRIEHNQKLFGEQQLKLLNSVTVAMHDNNIVQLSKLNDIVLLMGGLHEKVDNLHNTVATKSDDIFLNVTYLHEKLDASSLVVSGLHEKADNLHNTVATKSDEMFLNVTRLHEKLDASSLVVSGLHEKADAILSLSNNIFHDNLNGRKEVTMQNDINFVKIEDLFYESFIKLLNFRLYDFANNSYKKLYDECQKSANPELERLFLTKVSLESLVRNFESIEKTIVFGHFAVLFKEHIKSGKYFKPYYAQIAGKDGSGDLLLSPSILSEYVQDAESLVLTNPYLSMVFLRSCNLFEFLRDSAIKSVLLPINISVDPVRVAWDGFGNPEQSGASFVYRWAIGFDEVSSIKIQRNTTFKNITLAFDISVVHGFGVIIINAFGKEDRHNLSGSRKSIILKGSFDDVTEVSFNFVSDNSFYKNERRQLKFNVINLTIDCDGHIIKPYNTTYFSEAVAIDSLITERFTEAGCINIEKFFAVSGKQLKHIESFELVQNVNNNHLVEIPIYYKATRGGK